MWSVSEMKGLASMCAPLHALATSTSDEFGVIRENGNRQGIFKTWAVPVLPFLDTQSLDVLSNLWPVLVRNLPGQGFEETLNYLQIHSSKSTGLEAKRALSITQEWSELVATNPQRLRRSLERAQTNSWIIDQALTCLFNEIPLPKSFAERFEQLIARLDIAFGLMNPFYHLEVLAGESNSLPQEKRVTPSSTAGELDGISLLLPEVLRSYVTATHRKWNGLNWALIEKFTQTALSQPLPRKVILQICRLAGTCPSNVIFAANALAFIKPKQQVSIQGTTADELMVTTLTLLEQSESGQKTMNDVLADMNALIRFHNWLPLVRGEDNFQGKNWCYASVCDTTQELWKIATEHADEVWSKPFAKTFLRDLAPQVADLDASSAKGRFLLSLVLFEKQIRPTTIRWSRYRKAREQLLAQAIRSVTQRNCPAHSPSSWFHQGLTGNKSAGLSLVHAIKPELVLPGFVLTTSQIESWLYATPELRQSILALDRTKEVSEKKRLAKKIRALLLKQGLSNYVKRQIEKSVQRFGNCSLSVRSTSLEEGEARGVYETFLQVSFRNCSRSVCKCIASFYSTKAVLFRMVTGAGDLPTFAVLVQPYKRSVGGVAELYQSNSHSKRYITVSAGKTAAKVTSGHSDHHEWNNHNSHGPPNGFAEVVDLIEEFGEVFGSVQLEWLKEGCNLRALQMELLPHRNGEAKARTTLVKAKRVLHLQSLRDLPKIRQSLTQSSDVIALSLGDINLDTFQAELFAVIASFGKKITEIRLKESVSPSSHFANICRFFGIQLIVP